MVWRCPTCDCTADSDDMCACDRARAIPESVARLEERVAKLEAVVRQLDGRERVLHAAAIVDAPAYTEALKAPRACPLCGAFPDLRDECACYVRR